MNLFLGPTPTLSTCKYALISDLATPWLLQACKPGAAKQTRTSCKIMNGIPSQ